MQHKQYTGSQLAAIMKAELISPDEERIRVKDVLIDSRRLISPKNCLFFALSSKRNDGHKYISALYKRGVRYFVIEASKKEMISSFPDASFFLVNNTFAALQQLAQAHRSLFDIPVIGITGSNGKTIVKEWLFQLMSQKF